MIVLVSLIVLLRGLLVSTIFRMVHPYIRAFVPHIFHSSRITAATRMCTCIARAAPLSRVSLVKWRRSSSHTLGR